MKIYKETWWSVRRWYDNANAAGKRSHDGQSIDGRRMMLDLANVSADGVCTPVGSCEWTKAKPKVRNNAIQLTDSSAYFPAPIITDFIRNTKREHYDEELEQVLEMLDLESSKENETKNSASSWTPVHCNEEMRPTKMVQHG